MEKPIARATLVLVLTGSLLAAPATIKVVKDPAGLPLPFSRLARAGDFFVSDGKYSALIAATPRTAWSSINYGHPDISGYIAAFLPSGAASRPDIQVAYPSIRLNGKALVVTASAVQAEANAVVARASSRGPDGLRLDVVVRYTFSFDSGRIDAAAEIRNAGTAEIKGLSFSLGSNAWQSYSFSPFDDKSFPSLNFRVHERPDHALAWYNPNPVETSKAPLPGSLRPGAVHRLSYSVFTSSALPGLLARLYRAVRLQTVRTNLEIKRSDGPAEVIVREPATGAVFFRTFLDKPVPLSFPLPPGTYEVRANLFPAVVEKTFVAGPGKGATANTWTIEAPSLGRVRVAIADRKGRYVPGKVSFIGLAPTATPYFLPENPIATARSWETLKNDIEPPAGGLEVMLPTGTYLASASHGPEYAMDTLVVEVLSGEPPDLRFTVDRVLATPGLVSVDTHMHTQFSDGSVLVPRRLRSAAAEGVDVVVSSDHNTVTDYGPELDRLGLAGELALIPGAEVTARTGSIHFNAFPVAVRAGEPGNGAIAVRDETPSALFAASRQKNAGSLVQLNHPRSGGLGYFNTYDLDPEKAAFASAPFDPGFDVMEVMNGATFGGDNRRAIDDWLHLVNRGYPIRIVGSSDAHDVDGGETGYARTFVLMAEPVAGAIDREALVAAIRKGRSFVSNGPVIAARANRKATFGDMIAAKKGRVDLDITVTGAPWLDVSEVRLIVNGERRPPLAIKGADGRTVKFRDRVRVEMPRDGWIAIEVLGARSLYPLIQQRSGDGTSAEAALPYALTNPIFVDADRDGRSDPVWPEKIVIK
jgi:hypothetical protein